MSEVLVSVWMITYNHEKYISQALESILMQKSNYDVEVVIGEDYSTDQTRKIIQEYEKKYPTIIKPIYHKENVGAIRNAFEFCLPKLKGKYIACLEGDDYWTDPNKIQKQVDFLENHPDYGLVHSDADYLYEKENRLVRNYNRTNNIVIPQGNIFFDLISPDFPMLIKTATSIIRKNIVDKHFDFRIALDRKWKLTDLPLYIEIAYYSKIHYMDESMAIYRLNEESASRTSSAVKQYEFHKSVFDIYEYYCDKYSINKEIKRKLTIRFNKAMLNNAYKIRNVSLAKKSYNYLKSNGTALSKKEIILYLGTINNFFRYIIEFLRKNTR